MALRSVNPSTGELIREYPAASPEEVRLALLESSCAFAGWKGTSFAERAQRMQRAAAPLEERRQELARTGALEMGKPLAQGRAEVDKCAWVCRFYARSRDRLAARIARSTPKKARTVEGTLSKEVRIRASAGETK